MNRSAARTADGVTGLHSGRGFCGVALSIVSYRAARFA
jgi:hypothetical protein